jgi:DNA ligase-1
MQLARLVATSEAIAATRSRRAKAAHLGELLADISVEELPIAVAYLGGELPQGRIGLGYATIYRIDVTPATSASLELLDVDATLDRIADVSGPGSKAVREDELTDLLGAATDAEQSFLRRLMLHELRQGALEGIMVDALARATALDADALRRAAMVSGDLPAVATAALTGGSDALAAFRLQLFQPLQPMLAQTTEDAASALERFAPAVAEAKLDGARLQVHRLGDRVEAYTRNLRPVTDAVPEVVELVKRLDGDRLILDGEVIALQPDGRPHPFQVTMSRFGRSGDTGMDPTRLPLRAFFFDILHHDGEDLIDLPLLERIRRLDLITGSKHQPRRASVATAEQVRTFFDQVVGSGHEGIMVKDPASAYAAGRRGAAWLKLKPEHTLDLVVLAAEWGSGRRHGWLSNLHLGAREPASGEFIMLGKTFKGLTDSVLRWQTERFLELETHREGRVVYVRPEQVVEIAFDGVQASTRYPGGMALRFARVKGYRTDKSASEADTIDAVRAIFAGAHRMAMGTDRE